MVWFKGFVTGGLDWQGRVLDEKVVLKELEKDRYNLTRYGRVISLGKIFEFYESLLQHNVITSKGYLLKIPGKHVSSSHTMELDVVANVPGILKLTEDGEKGEKVSRRGIIRSQ